MATSSVKRPRWIFPDCSAPAIVHSLDLLQDESAGCVVSGNPLKVLPPQVWEAMPLNARASGPASHQRTSEESHVPGSWWNSQGQLLQLLSICQVMGLVQDPIHGQTPPPAAQERSSQRRPVSHEGQAPRLPLWAPSGLLWRRTLTSDMVVGPTDSPSCEDSCTTVGPADNSWPCRLRVGTGCTT